VGLSLADYAYVLENGEITVHGAAAELSTTVDVEAFYLGVGSHEFGAAHRTADRRTLRKRKELP